MGLGLSIVKSLLDLYGGEVWVEDREQGHPEKGSVFLVRMPAA
jgi:signal transduction histidine kinase